MVWRKLQLADSTTCFPICSVNVVTAEFDHGATVRRVLILVEIQNFSFQDDIPHSLDSGRVGFRVASLMVFR